jgi:hypothetical protein
LADEVALELGQAAQDGEHQTAVSAHASCSERNPAPAFAILSSVFNRSRADRARRSRRVTKSVSLSPRASIARRNRARSLRAPLAENLLGSGDAQLLHLIPCHALSQAARAASTARAL